MFQRVPMESLATVQCSVQYYFTDCCGQYTHKHYLLLLLFTPYCLSILYGGWNMECIHVYMCQFGLGVAGWFSANCVGWGSELASTPGPWVTCWGETTCWKASSCKLTGRFIHAARRRPLIHWKVIRRPSVDLFLFSVFEFEASSVWAQQGSCDCSLLNIIRV